MAVTTLILPGWQNSGPQHWQSRWERLYGYQRVDQHDWMHPLRGDWMMQLDEAVLAMPANERVVLAAHSLGCLLVTAWASHSQHKHRVQGALLVAPGDAQRPELQALLPSWSPIILSKSLPFASVLYGSQNDPYCSFDRAREFATAWGSRFIDYGASGHINAESNLGDWPDGHASLVELQTTANLS
ncbi:MAG: serine hydrolase family protein [Hylemonella sp.]|nr:serine hydrolase family protein [Hylemonella sp.]